MSILGLLEWIAATPWSVALHESLYMWPLVESTHVLSLTLFVGTAIMLDLRLLGVAMRRVPVSEVTGRLLPWTRLGFVVMVATGLLLFYATPVRNYQNIFFRLKMILFVLAGLNVWLFHSRIHQRVAEWDLDVAPAPGRPGGGSGVARRLGRRRRRRALHRLQLVRLRHPAAIGLRQLGRRLRGAGVTPTEPSPGWRPGSSS